jgi:hypothetical protein
VHDTINPPEPGGLFQLVPDDVIAEVFGDVGALLDDPAVHIGNVERAVGGIGQPYRTEALVGGGQELAALISLPDAQA